MHQDIRSSSYPAPAQVSSSGSLSGCQYPSDWPLLSCPACSSVIDPPREQLTQGFSRKGSVLSTSHLCQGHWKTPAVPIPLRGLGNLQEAVLGPCCVDTEEASLLLIPLLEGNPEKEVRHRPPLLPDTAGYHRYRSVSPCLLPRLHLGRVRDPQRPTCGFSSDLLWTHLFLSSTLATFASPG